MAPRSQKAHLRLLDSVQIFSAILSMEIIVPHQKIEANYRYHVVNRQAK